MDISLKYNLHKYEYLRKSCESLNSQCDTNISSAAIAPSASSEPIQITSRFILTGIIQVVVVSIRLIKINKRSSLSTQHSALSILHLHPSSKSKNYSLHQNYPKHFSIFIHLNSNHGFTHNELVPPHLDKHHLSHSILPPSPLILVHSYPK